MFRVRKKNERKTEFFRKFYVGRNGILADSDNGGIKLFEFLKIFSKGAGLSCAAGGVIFGVKIKNDFFAEKIRKFNGVSVFIKKLKLRSFVPFSSIFKNLFS